MNFSMDENVGESSKSKQVSSELPAAIYFCKVMPTWQTLYAVAHQTLKGVLCTSFRKSSMWKGLGSNAEQLFTLETFIMYNCMLYNVSFVLFLISFQLTCRCI